MTDLREAALELARAGVAVFPCGPDKAPRVAGGFHAATTDEHGVRRWVWDDDGTMIGAAIPEGVLVVDVDPRNGGDKTLAALPELPPTRTVRTKSGGFHYYYTVPESLTLRATLGPGVDAKRAGKGYVIVPPSPGYALATLDITPKPAPAWLLDELTVEPKSEVEGQASAPKFFPHEAGTAYGLAAMERELGRGRAAAGST